MRPPTPVVLWSLLVYPLAFGLYGCGPGTAPNAALTVGVSVRRFTIPPRAREVGSTHTDVIGLASITIGERVVVPHARLATPSSRFPTIEADRPPCASVMLCAWERREVARATARFATLGRRR